MQSTLLQLMTLSITNEELNEKLKQAEKDNDSIKRLELLGKIFECRLDMMHINFISSKTIHSELYENVRFILNVIFQIGDQENLSDIEALKVDEVLSYTRNAMCKIVNKESEHDFILQIQKLLANQFYTIEGQYYRLLQELKKPSNPKEKETLTIKLNKYNQDFDNIFSIISKVLKSEKMSYELICQLPLNEILTNFLMQYVNTFPSKQRIKTLDENLQIIVDAIITILKNEDVGEKITQELPISVIMDRLSIQRIEVTEELQRTSNSEEKQSLEKKLNKLYTDLETLKKPILTILRKRDVSDEIMQKLPLHTTLFILECEDIELYKRLLYVSDPKQKEKYQKILKENQSTFEIVTRFIYRKLNTNIPIHPQDQIGLTLKHILASFLIQYVRIQTGNKITKLIINDVEQSMIDPQEIINLYTDKSGKVIKNDEIKRLYIIGDILRQTQLRVSKGELNSSIITFKVLDNISAFCSILYTHYSRGLLAEPDDGKVLLEILIQIYKIIKNCNEFHTVKAEIEFGKNHPRTQQYKRYNDFNMELYKLSIEKNTHLIYFKTEDDIVRLEAILQSDKATRELLYSALRSGIIDQSPLDLNGLNKQIGEQEFDLKIGKLMQTIQKLLPSQVIDNTHKPNIPDFPLLEKISSPSFQRAIDDMINLLKENQDANIPLYIQAQLHNIVKHSLECMIHDTSRLFLNIAFAMVYKDEIHISLKLLFLKYLSYGMKFDIGSKNSSLKLSIIREALKTKKLEDIPGLFVSDKIKPAVDERIEYYKKVILEISKLPYVCKETIQYIKEYIEDLQYISKLDHSDCVVIFKSIECYITLGGCEIYFSFFNNNNTMTATHTIYYSKSMLESMLAKQQSTSQEENDQLTLGCLKINEKELWIRLSKDIYTELQSNISLRDRFMRAVERNFVKPVGENGVKILSQKGDFSLLELKILGDTQTGNNTVGNFRLLCIWKHDDNEIYSVGLHTHETLNKVINSFDVNPQALYNESKSCVMRDSNNSYQKFVEKSPNLSEIQK